MNEALATNMVRQMIATYVRGEIRWQYGEQNAAYGCKKGL